VTEQQKKSGLIRQILKVFYAPHKAFREVAQNQKYLGPVLIMIIFGAMFSLAVYTYLSKAYIEQTMPVTVNGDQWTENGTLWVSNAVIVESDDHISGGFYGNKSIDFSAANGTRIWMLLDNIGPVNCSGSQGYRNVSIRVKPIYPSDTEIANASLYLYSSSTDYFYFNLASHPLSSNGTWFNFTIPLGSENGWSSNGTSANWSNINGLKLEFDWTKSANLTVRVDGLLFRGLFKPILENGAYNLWSSFLSNLFQFATRWIIVTALVYMLIKWFGSAGPWKSVLILTGFALIPMVAQAAIDIVAFSIMPQLNVAFELIGGAEGEVQAMANQMTVDWFASLVYSVARIVAWVWIVALLSIMVRVSTKLSRLKSFAVAFMAFATAIIIEVLILQVLL
jgi:hypothetical protein